MKEMLASIGFYKEEMEELDGKFDAINKNKIIKIIVLLKRYHCSNEFMREVVVNYYRFESLDFDRLEFIIESIIANGDDIEDTLLELL